MRMPGSRTDNKHVETNKGEQEMQITLALEYDSDNSQQGNMTIRRGANRSRNLVIEIGEKATRDERQIEVNMKDLRNSLALLSGKGFDLCLSEQLRKLQQKARGAEEWEAINRAIIAAVREEEQ
jgi:hypothetical protein